MINLSKIIHSPAFVQNISIERTSGGHFEKSQYKSTKTVIAARGIIVNPKNSKEIEQTIQGDRATGYVDIYVDASTPIYVTRETLTQENNISDVVIASDGTRYRVTNIFNCAQWGFYEAEAQREGAI